MSFWLLLTGVLILLFGLLLSILPSSEQRRLDGLRRRAREAGLEVRLVSLPDPDPDPAERVSAGGKVRHPLLLCARYALEEPLSAVADPQDEDDDLVADLRYSRESRGWQLYRGRGEEISGGEESPLPKGWFFRQPEDPEKQPDHDLIAAGLGSVLDGLPGDVVAVEKTNTQVAVYWREKSALDQVVTGLQTLRKLVARGNEEP